MSIISHSHDTSTTYYQPLIVPAATIHHPLSHPFPTPFPTLNKTVTINNFGMLLFIEDTTVVYLFSDACLHVIDCLLYTTTVITFKSAIILLEMTLTITEQLQYCCEVCNAKQYWILWNHSLGDTVTVGNHNDVILDIIGYIYIICIIMNTIYSNRNHNSCTIGSVSYKIESKYNYWGYIKRKYSYCLYDCKLL